jgi:Flp pilus assembly protein TadD
MDRPSARLMPRAEAAFRAGDYASAERVLRRVLRTEPMNSKANELLAYIAGNRGDLEEVRARLETATSTPEASREAWYYLGKYFMQAGEASRRRSGVDARPLDRFRFLRGAS